MNNQERLQILAAYYGPTKVTKLVRSKVQKNELTILVSNTVFGDTWYGVRKTLVIFYRYGDSKVFQRVALEGETATIAHKDKHLGFYEPKWYAAKLRVLAAVYGTSDVTEKAARMVSKGTHDLSASDSVFGGSLAGTQKSLVVLYQRRGGSVKSQAVKESTIMHLK